MLKKTDDLVRKGVPMLQPAYLRFISLPLLEIVKNYRKGGQEGVCPVYNFLFKNGIIFFSILVFGYSFIRQFMFSVMMLTIIRTMCVAHGLVTQREKKHWQNAFAFSNL